MSYLVLSRNGDESFNKSLDPDLDHLREGPSHGFTPSRVKISSNSEQLFLSYACGQTN